ncbi:MAG: polysaccharide biosynthesis/export family protein, partial [Bacteroidota bacterium]
MKRLIFSLVLLLTAFAQVNAQIEDPKLKEEIEKRGISETDAAQELRNRGLSEEDVKRELESRGLLNQGGTDANGGIPPLPSTPPAEPEPAKEIKVEIPNETLDKVIDEVKPDNNAAPKSPVYGKDIFRDKRFELIEPQGNFKASDEYIVGSEDEITITITGNSEYNNSFRVDPDGYITIPQLSRLFLKGLTFADARQVITNAFGRVTNLRDPNTRIDIGLTYSRPISIGIYGEVFEPGGYTISALNTAFNALTLAGGPNNLGTVRQIKVLRSGEEDQFIDVYEY